MPFSGTSISPINITLNKFDNSLSGDNEFLLDNQNDFDVYLSINSDYVYLNSLDNINFSISLDDTQFNIGNYSYSIYTKRTEDNFLLRTTPLNLTVINDNYGGGEPPTPETPETYNLKYWFEYKNQELDEFRTEIYQLVWEGESTEIHGKCVHSYTKRKDLHDTIISSNLTMELEANLDLTLQDLYSEEEQTYLVKFFRNTEILFIGFIKPDGIFEDWVSDKWVLSSVDCYDGLNILKDLSFINKNNTFFFYPISELEAIYSSLLRTKLDLPINVNIGVLNNQYTFDIYHSILEQVYINTERYYQDAEKEKIMDCEEVVKTILSTYNATITQQNGEWWIYRPIDVKENMTFAKYVDGIYSEEITINVKKTIGSHVNSFTENFDVIHSGANQQKTISASCQAFRVNYKYGTVASVSENPNLQLGDGLNIAGWTVNNPDGKVYRNNSGFGINSSIILSNSTYFNNRVLLLKNNSGASVSEGDLLDLEIKFSNIGYAGSNTSYIGLHYEIYTDNYQFCLKRGTNQAYWKLKTLLNDTEDYYKFIQSNGEYGYGKGEAILNLSLPSFPENANIFISIFRDVTYSSDYSNEYRLILKSIKIIPKSNQLYKGEYHDAQFKKRISTKTKSDKIVYNGDTSSEIYYGTLLNANLDSLNAKWYRVGVTEERELLSICAEDNLRIAPRPMIEFSGDVYGYLPYLSLIEINNISGKFQFIEYSYDTKSNQLKLTNREFENALLDANSFTIDKSYDYGNTTKVTIKS